MFNYENMFGDYFVYYFFTIIMIMYLIFETTNISRTVYFEGRIIKFNPQDKEFDKI